MILLMSNHSASKELEQSSRELPAQPTLYKGLQPGALGNCGGIARETAVMWRLPVCEV